MLESIDAQQFLDAVMPALRKGDPAQLASDVRARWQPQQLCSLLHHSQADIRRTVAVTLGLVGDPEVIPDLAQALHDPDEQVNQMAEHGLWAIWFRQGDPCATKPFRDGVALLATESYEQAIACFRQSMAIDPRFAEAFNQCAIAHFFQYDWIRSIECSRQAVMLMPLHFGAIAGMGHCHTEMGDLGRAEGCYRRALAINPRMPAIQRMVERMAQRRRSTNDSSGEFLVDQAAR
jgi:tetratricopeptide (TPR) repeat protein